MRVNVKLNGEVLGTHEIGSSNSLQEVMSFYLCENETVDEADGLDFMQQVSAGNQWPFGDAVWGPLYIAEHVDAERLKHDRMREFYLQSGKTQVSTDYAKKLRAGAEFYGTGMSKTFGGIPVASVSDQTTLADYGDETCRAVWVFFKK